MKLFDETSKRYILTVQIEIFFYRIRQMFYVTVVYICRCGLCILSDGFGYGENFPHTTIENKLYNCLKRN